jgi:outer membrane protein assembly factor BamD
MHKKRILTIIFTILAVILINGCSSSKTEVTSDDPERAFAQAKKNYDNKEYTQAIEDFSFLVIKFQGQSIMPQVKFYLAQSYYYQEEYIFAENAYRDFLQEYGQSDFAEEALYMLGMTYYQLSPKYSLDQEYTNYAIQSFQNYTERYPSGRFYLQASTKITELKDKLAYSLYKSGELYMKMDKYRAANTYFERVRNEYIDSQWADDALTGQIEALIRLNRIDEAKKAIDRFYQFYPTSSLRSRVDRLKSSI